jgi:hypothetical protein
MPVNSRSERFIYYFNMLLWPEPHLYVQSVVNQYSNGRYILNYQKVIPLRITRVLKKKIDLSHGK